MIPTYKQDALYELSGVEAKITSITKQLGAANPNSVKIATALLPGLMLKRLALEQQAAALPERPARAVGYAANNTFPVREPFPEGQCPDYAAGVDLTIPYFLQRKPKGV